MHNTSARIINPELLRRFVLSGRSALLQLARQFVENGHQVLWLTDTPVEELHLALYTALDDVFCEFFSTTRARVFIQKQIWSNDLAALKNGERDFSYVNPNHYRIVLNSFLLSHPNV